MLVGFSTVLPKPLGGPVESRWEVSKSDPMGAQKGLTELPMGP